jgi:hypothetical protein
VYTDPARINKHSFELHRNRICPAVSV